MFNLHFSIVNFRLLLLSRVNNGEESIEFPYRPSKMIVWSPMALVLMPLKGVCKQDCMASTEGKMKR